jgi:hypothetical protein
MARRWTFLAVLAALAIGAVPASARPRHRDYTGFYQRTYPSPDGLVKVDMRIRSDGTAVIHTILPNGQDEEADGTWDKRAGKLVVMTPEGGVQWYRFYGHQLRLQGDKHVFFKKE